MTATQAIPSRRLLSRSLLEVEVGPHRFIRLDERLSVIQYRGTVEAEHIEEIARLIDALPNFMASALLTDCTEMDSFTLAARRALAALKFDEVPGSTVLMPVAVANVVRRAAMTLAMTAAKLSTKARLESLFEYDLDECIERARAWLADHPEPA